MKTLACVSLEGIGRDQGLSDARQVDVELSAIDRDHAFYNLKIRQSQLARSRLIDAKAGSPL